MAFLAGPLSLSVHLPVAAVGIGYPSQDDRWFSGTAMDCKLCVWNAHAESTSGKREQ